jgi:hypothetical protein
VEGFRAGFHQNLALLGPETVGKTTVLKRLIQQKLLGVPPSFVVLYLELRQEESFSEWAARFIQALLYGVLQAKQAEQPVLFPQLVEASSVWAPQTASLARRLLDLAESGKYEEVYDRLWDLPHQMTQEVKLPCFLVLDEFHRLRRFPVKDPFARLGRRIMVQSSTLYVVASSQPGIARAILREGLNLLFGQFEIVEMGPLDPAACLQAVRSALPATRVDAFLEHLLLELSQGYPGNLDLLLQGLVDQQITGLVDNQERILLDLLESLLLESQGVLRCRFQARVQSLPAHRSRRLWLEVLAAVANGCHRVHQIAEAVGRSTTQVVRALCVLQQSGLLSKTGLFCRVPDRLFQLWIVTAYPIIQGIDLTDPARVRACFRDAAWAWMARIREALRRPMEEQAMEFVRQWSGELVEIEGRKVLFPKCNRMERIPGPDGLPLIVARRAGREERGWLVIPWAGLLEEGQARHIAQEILRMPLKDYRKVLIGAYPVEINARLIFQEARVRLWDLQTLNDLLDLYGLCRIPLPPESQALDGFRHGLPSETIPFSHPPPPADVRVIENQAL